MSDSNFSFAVQRQSDRAFLTVFAPGQPPQAASDDHPNFGRIAALCHQELQDPGSVSATEVLDLFNVLKAVQTKFAQLSRRVSVRDDVVLVDNVPVHNAIAKQILRFVEEGIEVGGLVNFYEKIMANPTAHSRDQLYEWLDRHEFTIDLDGDIVGYKGVQRNPDGTLVSITHGPAVVNGVEVNGAVPNDIGNVVEMVRDSVMANPAVGCSVGLHVGTWEYASSFAQGAVLKVKMNPADVVSVPTDCNFQKVRCCRYTVIDVIDAKINSALDYDGGREDDAAFSVDVFFNGEPGNASAPVNTASDAYDAGVDAGYEDWTEFGVDDDAESEMTDYQSDLQSELGRGLNEDEQRDFCAGYAKGVERAQEDED